MSYEQESKLLEQFAEKIEKGQIIEVSEIKEAYEKILGHKTDPKQIYNVLHHHNWRNIKPRSKHPKKASEEAIEASKN